MTEQGPEHQPSGETEPREHPRIWVASLSDYNDGRLHGAWVDAAREPEEIWEDINQMLAAGAPHAEEIGIFDHDGYEGIAIGEYESIEMVARLAQGIVRWGRPFARWANHLDRAEWDDQLDAFEDRYAGTWESIEAYALDYLDACDIDPDNLPVPEFIRSYVTLDLEELARDLTADHHVTQEPDGTVYLFDP